MGREVSPNCRSRRQEAYPSPHSAPRRTSRHAVHVSHTFPPTLFFASTSIPASTCIQKYGKAKIESLHVSTFSHALRSCSQIARISRIQKPLRIALPHSVPLTKPLLYRGFLHCTAKPNFFLPRCLAVSNLQPKTFNFEPRRSVNIRATLSQHIPP